MAPSLSICLRTQTRVTLVTLTRLVKAPAVALAAAHATVDKNATALMAFKSKYGVAIVLDLLLFFCNTIL